MALLVQIRSERTQAGYGGAVDLEARLPDQRRSAAVNRQHVVDAVRGLVEAVERGEVDDLIVVESSAPDAVAIAQEHAADVVPGVHPATRELLEFFEFDHLTDQTLRDVSSEFHTLAHRMVNRGDLVGAELTTMLRKLVEAKDCAVRAAIRGRRAT
jgi:hypothetical protein